MRATVMEVSIDNLKYNIESIRKYTGNVQMMPIIKANGYGTYINKRLDIVNLFDIVGVAIVDEAISLRKLGYEKEIFVLNQPSIDEIDDIIKYNITVGVCSIPFMEEVKKKGKVKIHLEIDSGMGRTGIREFELDNFMQNINDNIIVEGIYTHLSSADTDFEYTNKQLDIFKRCVTKVKEKYHLKYIHADASNGIMNFKKDYYNLVRPGIILYGYGASNDTLDKIDLKPICKLKSKVTYLKEVDKNTSISYSRKYITKNKTKIATIPIGYADGLSRLLTNKGYVVINHKKYPIVGSVCMDNIMVDVGNDDISIGDDVYIWDNDLIKVEDIANIMHTINYEVMSIISDRVPRIFR